MKQYKDYTALLGLVEIDYPENTLFCVGSKATKHVKLSIPKVLCSDLQLLAETGGEFSGNIQLFRYIRRWTIKILKDITTDKDEEFLCLFAPPYVNYKSSGFYLFKEGKGYTVHLYYDVVNLPFDEEYKTLKDKNGEE